MEYEDTIEKAIDELCDEDLLKKEFNLKRIEVDYCGPSYFSDDGLPETCDVIIKDPVSKKKLAEIQKFAEEIIEAHHVCVYTKSQYDEMIKHEEEIWEVSKNE